MDAAESGRGVDPGAGARPRPRPYPSSSAQLTRTYEYGGGGEKLSGDLGLRNLHLRGVQGGTLQVCSQALTFVNDRFCGSSSTGVTIQPGRIST
ncbi:hypothetical protein NDU88_003593 [Pleurodeles waltl]|uniref:Uncharacterized protein n=1 Tax=Pleurodeles waltl TaxID=8319 RepID=A0AAV7NL30_PLEWA|nr:hypothetical protein NDU88_003593 [Pleurodeles waltl]